MRRLIRGDCLKVLPTLPEASVDSIVTDPPYGLRFMGKDWDHGIPRVPFWSAALRVLKPAHYMLCFGGTRTFHRMACAIEDAGFEIRDCLMWLYGSGFPKGKGCLKPAWEPILLARKPGPKVLPLQIDACRVECQGGSPAASRRETSRRTGHVSCKQGCYDRPLQDRSSAEAYLREREGEASGRWPANVIHDGSEEVVVGFPAQAGGGYGVRGGDTNGVASAQGINKYHRTGRKDLGQQVGFGDSGSAARFFYCAKASKRERDAGCEELAQRQAGVMDDDAYVWPENGDGSPRNKKVEPRRNHHPCVKPMALMRYLCRLITPPGGTVLDPFMGSGSTGKAAKMEGLDFIGIEKEAEYVEISKRRCEA